MTIKFIADYPPYKIGNTVTLTSAEETALVNQKVAVTDLTGGVPYVPETPSTLSSLVKQLLSGSQTAHPDITGVAAITESGDFVLTSGALLKSGVLVGSGYEPTIGGIVTQRIVVDAGSDVAHGEIVLTFNCGTAGDIAIASERLANADARAEVIKTAITGNTVDGAIYTLDFPSGVSSIYAAIKGQASYTKAAGAVATGAQAVEALFTGTPVLKSATIKIGSAYKSGGSNNRYRDIIVTGFPGA
ncbi:hypothetical protein [Methylophilus sp.]|uniref:hypothetical protein n=1 Tax=Methylophilus sp. TaxID=29541 RepID=UPI000D4B4129|nr:hypothetical protein [Methylophilus sp.]PPD12157.1 MAG: hypothetical protein CTY26_06085 [Methylophilus sp.]